MFDCLIWFLSFSVRFICCLLVESHQKSLVTFLMNRLPLKMCNAICARACVWGRDGWREKRRRAWIERRDETHTLKKSIESQTESRQLWKIQCKLIYLYAIDLSNDSNESRESSEKKGSHSVCRENIKWNKKLTLE